MMHKCIWLVLAGILFLSSCGGEIDRRYPFRLVRASTGLSNDEQLDWLKGIVQTASAHQINGLLLKGGFDSLDLRSEDYFRRLMDLKQFCEEREVEIIPFIFGIGYAGALLSHNRNLAAGLPVEGALYIAEGAEAAFISDSPKGLENGSFEEHDGVRIKGFEYTEGPGLDVSVDKKMVKEGRTSLRFELTEGQGEEDSDTKRGVSQEFRVTPHRSYRVSAWIRTEGMDSSKPFGSGNVKIKAYAAEDERQLEWININAPEAGDWFKVTLGFNSLEYDTVRIAIGPGEDGFGNFWIDDLRVEEVGLVNVLRRPGTPITVKGEANGIEYVEGKDFEPVSDPELNFRWDHEGPAIGLIKGGRIRDGERLRVSYYHGTHIYNGQVPVCLSEPEIYEIWKKNAFLMKEKMGFEKFFLNMDEARAGGTCAACKARNLPMKQILGDSITKAYSIIREVAPESEIFIWSDMLDPNHNASKRRGYYYHVPEVFYGSWEYIPEDLIIVCWSYRLREKSLKFFSDLGYRTVAGAYYDADDLENPKAWLEALSKTPGASGIIYTTWLRKYELLGEFGDLVGAAERPAL